MDWISEHWPWIAGVLGLLAKLVRDHFMVRDNKHRIDILEEKVSDHRVQQAEISRDVKHIRSTLDTVAKELNVSQKDIKDMMRGDN